MSSNGTQFVYQPVAIPPGETLIEVLETLSMSQKELAERMGRPLKLINEIIKGKATITPETAIQLERVVGKPATFWTQLEAGYQEALARQISEKELDTEVKKAREYPYLEMVKNGWIKETKNFTERAKNLLEFFAVNSLDNVVETKLVEPVLYRASSKKKIDPYGLSAWLRKGTIDAQGIEVDSFNEQILKQKVKVLRNLTTEKPEIFDAKIRKDLAESGVAFIVTKGLPNVPINGAARWLGDKALVQLTLYGRFADKFWFSLFHEIAHILFHGKRTFNIDLEGKGSTDLKEAQADEFARNILIPPEEYANFLRRGDFSGSSICRFAEKIDIAPGIVVGRLQFDHMIGFNQLNHLRARYVWTK
jgi:addiction module HigA family antidote